MIQKKFLTRLIKYDKHIQSIGLVVHSNVIFAYVNLLDDIVPVDDARGVKIMVKAGVNDAGVDPGVYSFDQVANIPVLEAKIKNMNKEERVVKDGDDVISIGSQQFGVTFHDAVKSTIGMGWTALKWKGDLLKNLSTLLDGASTNRYDRYVCMTDRRCYRTDYSFVSYINNGHRLKELAMGHVFMRPILSMMGKLTGMGTGGHRTAWQFENGAIAVEWPYDMTVYRILCGPLVEPESPEWQSYIEQHQLGHGARSPVAFSISDWVSLGLVAYDAKAHKQLEEFEDAAVIAADGGSVSIVASDTGEAVSLKMMTGGEPVSLTAKVKARYLVRGLDVLSKHAGRFKNKMSFELLINPQFTFPPKEGAKSPHPELLIMRRNNLHVMIAGTTKP